MFMFMMTQSEQIGLLALCSPIQSRQEVIFVHPTADDYNYNKLTPSELHTHVRTPVYDHEFHSKT